jgi:large subunit ribosomal protein L23
VILTDHDVLIKPVITEKSMMEAANKKYTFRVNVNSNKIQIKRAVERIFKVEVEKVTTINYTGKFRRVGKFRGRRASFKKAMVRLSPESGSIELFEGVS